ncbi:MAG: Acyl-CoA synthetase/AMP-acid ligase, partial [Alphaproteobacteria bacterium]|nr:Acyl-CoA synthetase/AMP-acid ligase [Alphaproteobacteria bacterium]
ALGITLFALDLSFASAHVILSDLALSNVRYFIGYIQHWRILADLMLIGICGGVYIVPLYAMLQQKSDAVFLARVIAANNVMNALFMVVSALAIIAMIALKFTIPHIFLIVAILNAFVGLYICKLLPDALPRFFVKSLFSVLYRVEVRGMENFYKAGKRVLIVANHASFLDPALIAAYLPERITFAINTNVGKKSWVKPLLSLVTALPLDPTNPLAAKTLIDVLKKDQYCMIFPEGRITNTGSLMKIYEGPGMIADKSGATLLPIRIDGTQYTPLSRMKGKLRIRWFPKITLTIMPPHEFKLPEEATGRRRRQLASAKLYDIMSEMMFISNEKDQTLFQALINAQKREGRKHVIVEDTERKPLNYGQFMTACFALGGAFKNIAGSKQNIGVLLPNAISTSVTFFALQGIGKTPAMLNFSAGAEQVTAACVLADVGTVLTSRRFIEVGRLDKITNALEQAKIRVIYLEDIRPTIKLPQKLKAKFASYFPREMADRKIDPASPAVILFTSGSEGTPKGVVLSHRNVQSNLHQVSARIDFGPNDKVFNCLPMFHAFGLTAGTVLPIFAGIKTFYYPSPLHYRIVPELIYDTNATVLFGTDTFLAGYARSAHPYDLHSIRYIVSGAEKLKEETRAVYASKFGLRVFEGYGATETSPVISVNTPMHHRVGTVGRFMPCMQYDLRPVPGIEEGGQLWVKGPSVMLGYLRDDQPGVLQPLEGGWYDTGDIVAVDEDGFITIKGRVKRFAKIAGEMVSLTAIEAAVTSLWPDAMHAVVAIPDERKGEQIILLTSQADAARDQLLAHFKAKNIPELSLPRKIKIVEKVPLLGTGKIDYQAAKAVVLGKE